MGLRCRFQGPFSGLAKDFLSQNELPVIIMWVREMRSETEDPAVLSACG